MSPARKQEFIMHLPFLARGGLCRTSTTVLDRCISGVRTERPYDSFYRLHDKQKDKILETIRIVGSKNKERLQSSKT
jgi:hypothetical protein